MRHLLFVCQLRRGMQSISVGTLIGVASYDQQVRDASNKQTSCVMSWCGRRGGQDGSSSTMVWVSAMFAALPAQSRTLNVIANVGVLRVAFNASGTPRWIVQMCHGVCPFGGVANNCYCCDCVFVETHSTTKPLRVLEQRLVSWQDATS